MLFRSLVLGSLEAGEWIAVGALLASSLLNIVYLLPIAINAFFAEAYEDHDDHGDTHEDHGEAPLACLLPLLATALACLVLFFWPAPFLNLARLAAAF